MIAGSGIRDRSVLRSMFRTTFITTAIIELSAVGAGVIDGVIVSRMLGTDSMAAVGIAYPFFSIAGVISGILAVGMQTMCSSFMARGKITEMQRVFTMVLAAASVLSLIAAAVMNLATTEIATLFGARGNAAGLLPEVEDYLDGLSMGIIPLILCVILSSAISLDSGNRLVRIAALTWSVCDVVFDLAAVYMGLGIYGIGLATSISCFINFLILLIHFVRKDRMIRLRFDGLKWSSLKEICILGSGTATRRALNVIRPIILNTIIISVGGSMGMSALSIRNNMDNFIDIIATGIASAVAVLISTGYGEKNREDCARICRLGQKYTAVSGCIFLILILIFAENIADFYVVSDDPELKALLKFSFYCLAAGNFFTSLVENRISYLRATEHIKRANGLIFLKKLAVIVVCAFICAHIWGSYGVILSFALSDALITLGIYVYYAIKCRKAVVRTEDMLDLPESFNYGPEDVIDIRVESMEDAVTVSERVQDFCNEHEMEDMKGVMAALCTEELTVNILKHGYKGDRVNTPVDIRVLAEGRDIIIRIRDNCPRFDINERIKNVEKQDDPFKNIGIRLVAASAKDIKYVNLIEVNIVIITI